MDIAWQILSGQDFEREGLHTFDGLTLDQGIHHVNRLRGQQADVLVDGDGLFALDDAVAAVSRGILTEIGTLPANP